MSIKKKNQQQQKTKNKQFVAKKTRLILFCREKNILVTIHFENNIISRRQVTGPSDKNMTGSTRSVLLKKRRLSKDLTVNSCTVAVYQ